MSTLEHDHDPHDRSPRDAGPRDLNPPAPSARQFEELQQRIIGFVRAFGLHQPDSTPCGQPIPVSEAHALTELAGGTVMAQQELGRRLRLRKSTVSRLVTQMTGRGWVTRQPNPSDGRGTLLRLTPQGEAAASQVTAARAARLARMLDAIPPAEREGVLRALHVLTEAADDNPQTSRPGA
jgi:DNA-binding MarR family transcriptional regulator